MSRTCSCTSWILVEQFSQNHWNFSVVPSSRIFSTTIPTEPYVPDVKSGDWKQIFALEAEWKKSKGYT